MNRPTKFRAAGTCNHRVLTRRDLLQRAGWILAASALPPTCLLGGDSVSTIMTRLSTYMADAGDRPLPADVIERTKQHILDTLAAMISGSALVPGRAAFRFVNSHRGDAIATVAASEILCDSIQAAFTNAMLAHSDETDDSHAPSLSHPGCVIVPAAWAVAEQFHADGNRLVRAVALGYDIGPRVIMTLGGPSFETNTHRSTHSIAGMFGASAAAGCLANLNSQQMRWLLDYAAQQASGVAAWQRDTDHIEKAFVFAAASARSGVTAALLVQSGWTGVDDVMSGPDNFLISCVPDADPAGLVDKLGERYEIVRTNFKKWTVGSPIQAPLDATEILIKRHPFKTVELQSVVVRVAAHEASIVNNRAIPDICLQHMVAVMLVDRTVTFASAHDKERMSDPFVLGVRAKVQLVPDEVLDHRLPRREALVEITLKDGTRLSEHVEAVRGTAENPMTREEVVEKCRNLISPILGKAQCSSLIEKVLNLEAVNNLVELRPLLQRAEPAP
jgi:2-methylcitrate dehydratase PrpD